MKFNSCIAELIFISIYHIHTHLSYVNIRIDQNSEEDHLRSSSRVQRTLL